MSDTEYLTESVKIKGNPSPRPAVTFGSRSISFYNFSFGRLPYIYCVHHSLKRFVFFFLLLTLQVSNIFLFVAFVSAEQLEVAFAILATVEAHSLAGVHPVMLVSSWLNTIEVEVLGGSTLETYSPELEFKLEVGFPRPFFLTFCHCSNAL